MSDSFSSTRRDRLLEQMGITQFELYRPMALKGEVAVSLPAQIRLIIVAQQLPDLTNSLLQDVLRSLSLNAGQVYCLAPEQTVMLPGELTCALWHIGDAPLTETLAQHPLRLTSPALSELAASPAAKRNLWQQFCQHENYFSPHP